MNIYHKIYKELQKNHCYFCNKLMNDTNSAFDENKIKNSNHFILNHNSGYCECGLNYVTFSKYDRDFSNIKFSYLLTNLHIWVSVEQSNRYTYQHTIGLYNPTDDEEHLHITYELDTNKNEFLGYVPGLDEREVKFLNADSKEDLLKIENEILKEIVFK